MSSLSRLGRSMMSAGGVATVNLIWLWTVSGTAGISFLGYDFQSYPNFHKISLNILTYPYISYHILPYPKISSGANSQMVVG